ncbi:MAG: DNA methyltransferase [Prevotella sp.]|nr:DNA methyltransferase [Prevotella sp.]
MNQEKTQAAAAMAFANEWSGKGYEKGESQTFWLTLLSKVYGVREPEKYIHFEEQVQLDKTSFIDAYIDATHVMIEQKSKDKDLRKAIKQSDGTMLTPYQQAQRYSAALPYSKRPRWIVTCNFHEFLVYDMEHPNSEPQQIELKDLGKEHYRLQFLVETENLHLQKEKEVSLQAGEIVGKIYDELLKQYLHPDNLESLKSLNVLCVRLVFCLYCEDAGLFGRHDMFHDYLEQYTTENLRMALIRLFKVLNTPPEQRDPYLKDDLAAFPYVNGGLFANENIEIPRMNDKLRKLLLQNASLDFDWSGISPTIFGAVFESTLNPETRHNGGMHYTSVENIHKVIDPLFLDGLKQEFCEIKHITVMKSRVKRLHAFQDKLASLTFFDPACGSGNFLTESFISLRRLENDVIKEIYQLESFDAFVNPIKVNIHQFYGLEINDFAVTVATTALWISEAQTIQETEHIVHHDIDFLPLKDYKNIHEGNALNIDWNSIIPANKLNYIMGNPPFLGASVMSAMQKKETVNVIGNIKLANSIDYVGAWYCLATRMIANTNIECAFVSTNSITQGEQVTPLWKPLIKAGIRINFAYRTFRWDSEASDKAAVHCVIIGFGMKDRTIKTIFNEDGSQLKVNHINAYLYDAPDAFIESRSKPICDVPKSTKGNQPTDNGNFILTLEERNDILGKTPELAPYIRRYIGARDYLNNDQIRYCLWLKDASPTILNKNKEVKRRLEAIREFRAKSTAAPTRKSAETPYKFFSTPQTKGEYLIIPRVSSQRRRYIPIGFMGGDTIAADSCTIICGANRYQFGILESNVHMAWMRFVAGRLKSDYRYSASVVYNNFPWPKPTEVQKHRITKTAQMILDVRAKYNATLADLYNPTSMPHDLLEAHRANDRAVMEAYGFNWHCMKESQCVEELLRLYEKLT